MTAGSSDRGSMRTIFAGGGTGGHLMPGAATAEALRRLMPASRSLFLVTSHKAERLFGAAIADYASAEIPATPWEGRGDKFRLPLRALAAARRTLNVLRAFRPHLLVGLGSSGCAVPVVLGRLLGVRTALFEANAVPGRAVRLLAPLADGVVLQFECAAAAMKARRVLALGNPVRARLFGIDRAAARQRFGLRPDRVTMLVTGGSQGAAALNGALFEALDLLRRGGTDLQVLHLTGVEHEAEALRRGVGLEGSYRAIGFLEDVEEAFAAADFVLSRAGASSLAYATALGLPSILVPYPAAADNHQQANAEILAGAGAATLMPQADMTPYRLADAIAALAADEAARARMAARARAIGRPQAAAEIARALAALAGFGTADENTSKHSYGISTRLSKAA